MEDWLSGQYTWGNFLVAVLFFLGLFFVLGFLGQLIQRAVYPGRFQTGLQKVHQYFLLIFEPLALIVLTGIFIMIDPVFHGLLAALVFFSSFLHIRNYMSGLIFQFNPVISKGNRLRTTGLSGVIARIRRLGIDLQTNEGFHFVSYSQLLAGGYTLLAGEEIGGFYYLEIKKEEPADPKQVTQHLLDLLTTAPYLDWNHKPELMVSDESPGRIKARVLLKEESHLPELTALIGEWGYSCKTVKPNIAEE